MQLKSIVVASLFVGVMLFGGISYANIKADPKPGSELWSISIDQLAKDLSKDAIVSTKKMVLSPDKTKLYFMCKVECYLWHLFALDTVNKSFAYQSTRAFTEDGYLSASPDGGIYVSMPVANIITRVEPDGKVWDGNTINPLNQLASGPCGIDESGTVYFADNKIVYAYYKLIPLQGYKLKWGYPLASDEGNQIKLNPVVGDSFLGVITKNNPLVYLNIMLCDGTQLSSLHGDEEFENIAMAYDNDGYQYQYLGGKSLKASMGIYLSSITEWEISLKGFQVISSRDWIGIGKTMLYVACWSGNPDDQSPHIFGVDLRGDMKWDIDLSDSMSQILGVLMGKDDKAYVLCNGKDNHGYLESVNPDGTYKQIWKCDKSVASFTIDKSKNIAYVLTSDAYVFAINI